MGITELLHGGQIVAQIVTFLVLFGLLRVFVWKRFLKVLDDRRTRIAAEFDQIEMMKSETASVRARYEADCAAIDAVSKQKIQEAIAEGKRIADAVTKSAEAESRKMVDEAKEAIRGEVARAHETLKEEIVDLALGAAGKVIEEKLTESDDRKIVDEFLKGIGEKR